MPDLSELLALAAATAMEAGELLRAGLRDERAFVGTKSTATDMVTEMDRAAEELIIRRLTEARPDDGVLAEEGGGSSGTSGVRWIVDPLDGTTNYLYRFPPFAVSIAAELDGVVTVGAVHDAAHGETFTAVRGGGARCDERPLRVIGPGSLAVALVATGFGYHPDQRARQAAVLSHVLPHVRDVRRAGAAAIDLCWVADGRVDAYYERGLNWWDLAAGGLVAAEAGAWVGDLDGHPPAEGNAITLACPPQLAAEFRSLVADAEAASASEPGQEP